MYYDIFVGSFFTKGTITMNQLKTLRKNRNISQADIASKL